MKFCCLFFTIRLFLLLGLPFFLGSCAKNISNPFSDGNREIQSNVNNLMNLAIGMNKYQVRDLCGIANLPEGYDWGSVWFYKTQTGPESGVFSNEVIKRQYTPVVFDNTDRVIGYGWKFYEQTLSDLGTGQY